MTALGLSRIDQGLIEPLPLAADRARASVLAGRAVADIVTNTMGIVVVLLATGLIIGFQLPGRQVEIVAGILLLLLFGFASSWIFAVIGMSVSSPEAANRVGFTLIFPITFISRRSCRSPRCRARWSGLPRSTR